MALIQIRRGTAASWTSENPTLEAGEFGLETDTGKTKIGNGSTAWTSLTYNYVTYAQIDTTGASVNQTLVHNGTKFVPGAATSSLDSLTDVTAPNPSDGDFLRWNGTVWINDAVNLSTDTIGSYVASLVAGTGVTLTNNSGEGATPTVAVTANTFDAFGAASTAATNAATALTNHEADTTSIHGIADTSILVTTTGSQTLTNKTITSPSGLVKGDVGLGNVNNTADTAKPVSTAQQTALDLKANLASPTFTGTVSGISATMVGLGSVNNTADTAKPVSTAQQTALDLKANLASPTFTGTVVLPSTTSIGNVSNTEIGYLDGVTSAIQTQINNAIDSESIVTGGNAYTIQFNVLGAVDAMRA